VTQENKKTTIARVRTYKARAKNEPQEPRTKVKLPPKN